MANRLYEENSIRDIADAIREKNGSTEKYTVSQMGDAIRNIETSSDEPIVIDENRKVYTGTITEIIKGTGGEHVVLVKDSVLAEHKDDAKLFVRVEFDIETTAYTVVKNWAFNTVGTFPMATNLQYIHRTGSDGSQSFGVSTAPINNPTPVGVGCVQITDDGELRIYSNSSNYAIRPSNYKVTVEW